MNLFVSCPMDGRKEEDIIETIARMHDIAQVVFETELDVVPSYQRDREASGAPIACLGESIKGMQYADFFIGVKESHRGTDIERDVAKKYQIPMFLIEEKFVLRKAMPLVDGDKNGKS